MNTKRSAQGTVLVIPTDYCFDLYFWEGLGHPLEENLQTLPLFVLCVLKTSFHVWKC